MATGTMRRQQIQSVSHFQYYNIFPPCIFFSLWMHSATIGTKYNFTGYEWFYMSFQYVPTVMVNSLSAYRSINPYARPILWFFIWNRVLIFAWQFKAQMLKLNNVWSLLWVCYDNRGWQGWIHTSITVRVLVDCTMVWLPRYSRQEDLPSTFFSKMFWARFYHCVVTYGTSTCIQFQKIKNKNKKTEKSPGDENNSIINLYGNTSNL